LSEQGPWTAAQATEEIRKIARSPNLAISYKLHATERLSERGIIMSDVLYVLKNGFVYEENPEPATREGYHRYPVENKCPNGGNRNVRVVVIPDKKLCHLKIITVMWVDEASAKAGTLIGEQNG
jgi:hypothetical protein